MKVIKSLAMALTMTLALGMAALSGPNTAHAGICTGHQGQMLLSSARKATGVVVNAPMPQLIGGIVYMTYTKFTDGTSLMASYLLLPSKFIKLPTLCSTTGAPLAKPDFWFLDAVTGTDIDTTRPANQDQYLGFMIGTLTLNIA